MNMRVLSPFRVPWVLLLGSTAADANQSTILRKPADCIFPTLIHQFSVALGALKKEALTPVLGERLECLAGNTCRFIVHIWAPSEPLGLKAGLQPTGIQTRH